MSVLAVFGEVSGYYCYGCVVFRGYGGLLLFMEDLLDCCCRCIVILGWLICPNSAIAHGISIWVFEYSDCIDIDRLISSTRTDYQAVL